MTKLDWNKGKYEPRKKKWTMERKQVQVAWPESDKVYVFANVTAVRKKLGVSPNQIRIALRDARFRVAAGPLKGFGLKWHTR